MKSQIYQKLKIFFEPKVLEVINESKLHKGHAQSPQTGNSHFFIKISSRKLDNQSRVNGQRMVYKVLEEELKNHIHALRIQIVYNDNY